MVFFFVGRDAWTTRPDTGISAMDSHLAGLLKSALSLLPEPQVEKAVSEVLRRYRDGDSTEARIIYWADFTLDGRFTRGGISDMGHHETHVTTNSQEFREIGDLIRLVRSESVEAGSFHWDAAKRRLIWVLPLTRPRDGQEHDTSLRCLSISDAVFHGILARFNANANLSPSEARVVFQVVAGIDLRDAAEEDGVSYETKRMHLKNASQKLQCRGQKEILRKVLGQMVHLLTASDAETANIDIAETFVSRYLADDTRLSIHRLGNGRLLRILEAGPADGKPVIMIHGMMFPITLRGLARHLHDARIRLIVPIRPGFLEAASVSPLFLAEDLIARALEDIALFIQKSGLSPAPVVGLSLGATVATRFACDYPKCVSRLILMSTNLTQTRDAKESQAARFYTAMRDLAGEPEIFAIINRQYTQYYADRKTCKDMLQRLFGACDTDVKVLNGAYSHMPAYDMFAELYGNSTAGMTADFVFTMRRWKSAAKTLPMPVTIVHGAKDPLTSVGELDGLVATASTHETIVIDDGGHFISASHAAEVWPLVGAMS